MTKENKIILPRVDETGKPRVSYSQISSWNEEKAFNKIQDENGVYKEISGKTGYCLSYFLDYVFPPNAMDIYGVFGAKVEDAICLQKYDGFDKREIELLKQITPLGVFQSPIDIDFGGDFSISGFIDDCNADRTHLRDYKTCSESSSKKYEKEEYYQLDIYALDEYKKTGKLPKVIEVCAIQRVGSHFKNGGQLNVGDKTWIIPRSTSKERLEYVEEHVRKTVQEISDAFKVFLEVAKIKAK